MIGDNYVTGDNIYLRELQNFFFEVLGMMSITHYGAIGDGRKDNYGALQVAIDDANRRGLSFIYVPYGRFIYTGELKNIGDIIFMGNPHAHIVNIRTGEEIKIYQFGWFWKGNMLNNFYETIDEPITLYADGTTNPILTNDKYYYLTADNPIIYYDEGGEKRTTFKFSNSIFYYYNSGSVNRLVRQMHSGTMSNEEASLIHNSTFWYLNEYNCVLNENGPVFTTDIISSSSSEDVPTVGAVMNYAGRNLYMIGPDDNQTIDEFTTILCTPKNYVGSKLTYSNNAIVIGQGVTKIKLAAHIRGTITNDTSCTLFARKNNGTVCRLGEIFSADTTSGKFQTAVSDYIVDVQEGDTISLAGQPTHEGGRLSTNPGSTWLTVEAIG